MSILHKLLAASVTTVVAVGASILATSPSAAQNYSYGGVRYFGNTPAYTFQGGAGSRNGNVTFFGAPPATYQSHNGQMGNVTFLGGARPYTYPTHSGQYGNVTAISTVRPAGMVPAPNVIRTPNIVRIR